MIKSISAKRGGLLVCDRKNLFEEETFSSLSTNAALESKKWPNGGPRGLNTTLNRSDIPRLFDSTQRLKT